MKVIIGKNTYLGHIFWDIFWGHFLGPLEWRCNQPESRRPRPGGTSALGGSAALEGAGHGTAQQGLEWRSCTADGIWDVDVFFFF